MSGKSLGLHFNVHMWAPKRSDAPIELFIEMATFFSATEFLATRESERKRIRTSGARPQCTIWLVLVFLDGAENKRLTRDNTKKRRN